MGTPDFVAPEALDSEQTPDHRADLYAVGVMLYQMLTGKLPRGSFQLPSELNPEVDPRLDEIVTKATASHPDYRYASAAAMRADLDQVLSQPMAKVEAGERSGAVAAAVPVTSSVRGGKVGKHASNLPVYLGVGLAAVLLVVGLVLLATRGDQEATTGTAGVSPGAPLPAPEAPEAAPGQNGGKSSGRDARGPSVVAFAPGEESPESTDIPVAAAETETEPHSDVAAPEEPAPPLTATEPTPIESPPAADSPPLTESPTAASSPPNEEPSTKNEELLAIPGLQTRLNAYLTARNAQLSDLATKYGRGLDSRLDQAADAGDLSLSTAFAGERNRVAALVATLEASPSDPIEAACVSLELEALPEDAPEGLAALRKTWDREAGAILADLGGKLGQSLQAL